MKPGTTRKRTCRIFPVRLVGIGQNPVKFIRIFVGMEKTCEQSRASDSCMGYSIIYGHGLICAHFGLTCTHKHCFWPLDSSAHAFGTHIYNTHVFSGLICAHILDSHVHTSLFLDSHVHTDDWGLPFRFWGLGQGAGFRGGVCGGFV